MPETTTAAMGHNLTDPNAPELPDSGEEGDG